MARVLREKLPNTKLVITEPDAAQLIGSNNHQLRNKDGSAAESHPDWNPHPIQGWTTDFIPLVLQESIDNNYFDELLPVSGDQGIYWANKLAKKEGIITGVSGGSTFAIAAEIAKKAPEGSNILCMLPDTGERYLSSPLFEDVGEDMNEVELALSFSTPGFHLNE